jgi:hypothetical protein
MQLAKVREKRDLLAEVDESRSRIQPELVGNSLTARLGDYDGARSMFTGDATIDSVERARGLYALLNDIWRIVVEMVEIVARQVNEGDEDPTGVLEFADRLYEFCMAAVRCGRREQLWEENEVNAELLRALRKYRASRR